MRIPCPLCGERPLEEFTYRGDAKVKRPDHDAPIEDWVGYVYVRDNPKGDHQEHWRHSGGCGSWLTVNRNTVSHIINSVEEARQTEESRISEKTQEKKLA
ncbi:sarcosine oxidase subunit delta [Kiloniella laminariae]|uniref:Sarcosine oxidase subunit delta n=1 Tax=Kiloniella laminariae TaxID=454162 RepID=A0ABT4LPK6_9PROT|nr:sarcosine oxidase subunit delta [Kiloniella laminariae]MCZ4283059.1 sarcosine oxidase subunit delta [Kiloniella laminariae]